MKLVFTGVALSLLMMMSGLGQAAYSEEDAQARCRQWAQDDEIKPAELDEYMAQCLEEQRNAAQDEAGGGDMQEPKSGSTD
jgi:hypothetical protein